jgi:hypothetical protein
VQTAAAIKPSRLLRRIDDLILAAVEAHRRAIKANLESRQTINEMVRLRDEIKRGVGK